MNNPWIIKPCCITFYYNENSCELTQGVIADIPRLVLELLRHITLRVNKPYVNLIWQLCGCSYTLTVTLVAAVVPNPQLQKTPGHFQVPGRFKYTDQSTLMTRRVYCCWRFLFQWFHAVHWCPGVCTGTSSSSGYRVIPDVARMTRRMHGSLYV